MFPRVGNAIRGCNMRRQESVGPVHVEANTATAQFPGRGENLGIACPAFDHHPFPGRGPRQGDLLREGDITLPGQVAQKLHALAGQSRFAACGEHRVQVGDIDHLAVRLAPLLGRCADYRCRQLEPRYEFVQ